MAYLIALAAGVLTSFTPCVYPVIPITVGYIGAKAAGSRVKGFLLSISYVIGIAVTYSALGAFAALTGRIFGQASTSPLSYLITAGVAIVMGLSMAGLFNIALPSFLTSPRVNIKGRGIAAAFLMGIAAGLVIGPCTAPVLAVTLSYVAAKQNLAYGVTVLFTYAFGMGFLLILAGTFTGLILSLPKSGPWLERVKKGFGWLLVAAGGYFLFMAGRLSV